MKSSLVTRIALTNFRGLAEATLDGLAPLTVLTGRNGCGKSTVLEALFIGVSTDPALALAKVVGRRRRTPNAACWLFSRGQTNLRARIAPVIEGIAPYDRLLMATDASARRIEIADGPEGRSSSSVEFSDDQPPFRTSVGHQGKLVRLIDTSQLTDDLAIALSNLRGQVFRSQVDEMIGLLLPGAIRLEVSIPSPSAYSVEVTFRDYAVPLSFAGDGIQAAAQMAIELGQIPEEGLALIEEPEVFLHPRALRQIAQVLLRTMNRGVQVVLTTHSLDLIDSLVQESTEEDESKMALFRLRLDEGKLFRGRYSGSEMTFARTEIAEDLR